MNIVDFFVVLAFLSSIWRGHQFGLVRQFGSTLGFVIGLWISVPLGRWLADYADDPNVKTLITALTLIVVAFGLMTIGELIGLRVKLHVREGQFIDRIDSIFGSFLASATLILGLWLGSALISLLPQTTVTQLIRSSLSFGVIDRRFPPASQALAGLNHLIDPNRTPLVFSGREPSPEQSIDLPPLSDYSTIIEAVSPSIVRIQGLGCGGLINGTGFIAHPNRVVTNAHVVAGIANPKVYDKNGTHDTTVIYFDPQKDLAILAVSGLAGKPLKLVDEPLENGSAGIVIGYPGGGEESAQMVGVQDRVSALGRDIYGRGKSIRDVYILQANLIPGNSGGPLLDLTGRVVGVVFGTSTSYNNVGYALSLKQLSEAINSSKSATTAQPTGSCSTI